MKKILLGIAVFITTAILCIVSAGAETYGDYEYAVLGDGTVGIMDYTGSATELDIPSEIDGTKVTSIGSSAFGDCTSLTSVTIPDSVTSIGYRAFYWCDSLVSVTVPDSVTNIGEDAFFYCTSLTSVTIPDSVTNIGEDAFGYLIEFWPRLDIVKVDSFTINCYKGTAGEKYAINEGFTYNLLGVAPTAMKGFKLGGRANNALRLNWTKNTSADGYIIEQYNGSKWVRIAKIASPATTTYRVTGLKEGTAYKFRVRTYNMVGKTALYSNYVNISGTTK